MSVSAQGSQPPPQHRGHYPVDRRPDLKRTIRGTDLDDATSLAAAIRSLPALVSRRPAGSAQAINVVLVSDGFDSCGGDPCAAAADVERQRPDIDINVVAVSRAIEGLNCISRNTGGKFFQPRDTSQVAQLLARAAGQGSPDPWPSLQQQRAHLPWSGDRPCRCP